ncbi:MAG: nucleotide exchange factor GrpE [Chloroflexota bacterium]
MTNENTQERAVPEGAPQNEQPGAGEAERRAGTETETIEALRTQLEEERNRAEGYLRSWQRAAADFQNYKRRVEEERQRNTLYANLALVLNMLPIYDDLCRALENVDASIAGSAWVEGVRQIARKFQGALEASGVKEIPAEPGMDFDPTRHEAVAQDEGEPGKIVRVLQKGYTMGDRVIRPAMVTVGRHD